MPAHDWTRVGAGTFHDFHLRWIAHLQEALNSGLLPADYYALAEQRAGDVSPDVLTLHAEAEPPPNVDSGDSLRGAVALAEAPPQVSLTLFAEEAYYAARRRTLVVRHASGDRIVAMVEIVSPGNKSSRRDLDQFVDKALAALDEGLHLLIVDLFPPGRLDPDGINGAVWNQLSGQRLELPPDKPLSAASYVGAAVPMAYAEPLAPGDLLPDLPLFLDPDWYVNLPLERTYDETWRGVPERWRRVIEA